MAPMLKARPAVCNIIPEQLSERHSGSIFAQAEILEKEAAGMFPKQEDYDKYKWVCRCGCDRNGTHSS